MSSSSCLSRKFQQRMLFIFALSLSWDAFICTCSFSCSFFVCTCGCIVLVSFMRPVATLKAVFCTVCILFKLVTETIGPRGYHMWCNSTELKNKHHFIVAIWTWYIWKCIFQNLHRYYSSFRYCIKLSNVYVLRDQKNTETHREFRKYLPKLSLKFRS